MKILAFAASSSTKSINKILVTYATSLLDSTDVDILDLNDFELPLFSEDKELELGKPELAKLFLAKIEEADALIISFAEHNASYSTAYKNLFDWCSRINQKVFQNKPMILLATSPGRGGGANVLKTALNSIPHFGGIVKGSYSLPKFYDNFDTNKNEISNPKMALEFKNIVSSLE